MEREPCLLREDHGLVTTLTLNRPRARNALSLELLQSLSAALDAVQDSRVLVIAAAGPAFCAGHDLKELSSGSYDPEQSRDIFRSCSAVMQALTALPIPVIAQVQGIATAAGCQLVASCDLAIAADDAKFATPGITIGLFCSTPMVPLSRNVGRKAAMQMLLTGDAIDATTALAIGLVSEIAPRELLAERTRILAQRIAEKPAAVLALGKRAFYRQIDMTPGDAYDFATEAMIDNLQQPAAKEGINAFLEKRPPNW